MKYKAWTVDSLVWRGQSNEQQLTPISVRFPVKSWDILVSEMSTQSLAPNQPTI